MENSSKRIAFVAALPEEMEPLRKVATAIKEEVSDRLSAIYSCSLPFVKDEIFFSLVGVGKALASANTQRIIDRFQPDLIFLIGSCGGPTKGAYPGDIVIPTSTAQSDYDLTCSGYELGASKGVTGLLPVFAETETQFGNSIREQAHHLVEVEGRTPRILSGVMTSRDSLITQSVEIEAVERSFHHVGWDMEAAAVNLIANLNGIPCCIVKGILDRNGIHDKSLSKKIEKTVYENLFQIVYSALKENKKSFG